MRVAIAATDIHPDSRVYETFGMSPYFIIFDSTTRETTTIQNPIQTSGASTGVEVARTLVNQRIDKVAGGMFGERVRRIFLDAGVQMEVVREKTVKEYIESLPNPATGTKSSQFPSSQTIHLDNKPTQIDRGSCYCSNCGYATAEETEAPCFQQHCPNCKTPLERMF